MSEEQSPPPGRDPSKSAAADLAGHPERRKAVPSTPTVRTGRRLSDHHECPLLWTVRDREYVQGLAGRYGLADLFAHFATLEDVASWVTEERLHREQEAARHREDAAKLAAQLGAQRREQAQRAQVAAKALAPIVTVLTTLLSVIVAGQFQSLRAIGASTTAAVAAAIALALVLVNVVLYSRIGRLDVPPAPAADLSRGPAPPTIGP